MALDKILKRDTYHSGDIVMMQGEVYENAFIIQSGEVTAKVREDDKQMLIAKYGPGMIIGEQSLLANTPSQLTYEATCETTLITISRKDFDKKLKKTENTVRSVLKHLNTKVLRLEQKALEDAKRRANIDKEAHEMVEFLIRNLSDEKKPEYAEAMLPHFNELVHVLRAVQERHRHEAQKKHMAEIQARAKGEASADADQTQPKVKEDA